MGRHKNKIRSHKRKESPLNKSKNKENSIEANKEAEYSESSKEEQVKKYKPRKIAKTSINAKNSFDISKTSDKEGKSEILMNNDTKPSDSQVLDSFSSHSDDVQIIEEDASRSHDQFFEDKFGDFKQPKDTNSLTIEFNEEKPVNKRGRKKKNVVPVVIQKEECKRISRKDKMIYHFNKDQFQIMYPDLREFKNRKHAIESLLPYHLLQKEFIEDQQFNEIFDIEHLLDADCILKRIENGILQCENSFYKDENLVVEILKTEEMKYFLYRVKSKIKDDEAAFNYKVKLKVDKIEIIPGVIKLDIDRSYYFGSCNAYM